MLLMLLLLLLWWWLLLLRGHSKSSRLLLLLLLLSLHVRRQDHLMMLETGRPWIRRQTIAEALEVERSARGCRRCRLGLVISEVRIGAGLWWRLHRNVAHAHRHRTRDHARRKRARLCGRRHRGKLARVHVRLERHLTGRRSH